MIKINLWIFSRKLLKESMKMIIEGNSYRYYFLCPETYEDIVLQYHCDRSKAIDFGLSFVIFTNNKVSTIRTKCALEFIARPYLNSRKCDWKWKICMFSLSEIMNKCRNFVMIYEI